MVSRYQTKEPVHCFMQHCAPTHHPAHQHHGHHQHHPQHHHQPHHPAPPHLNHHPHHPHHPAQHHHQSHHHHHHQASPTGPPPSALHAPPPLPPQQPPQNQPNPQQQQQAQQQPQLGSFRIVAAAAAAAAAAARSDSFFPPNFTHQGRSIHSGPPPPPHHSGVLGGLGAGAGSGPQGGGGGVGGGGGGPAQAPTPPGASPHDMAKQGGGPPTQPTHMGAHSQMPGASGLSMSYSISNPQRPSGPQNQYFRNANQQRMMTNPRSQVMNSNGVPTIGFQQISPAFSVPPVFMPPQWVSHRQPPGYTFSTSTQTPVLFPSMYQYVANQSPQNHYIMMRPPAAGASTGGGGHGGTPPQQQTLQQQSPVALQQQTVIGAGGGPGAGISLGGGGGGPSGHIVGSVYPTVNVSGVVNMGGNVGQPTVQTKAKPRLHALPIVHPITGEDIVNEMLKSEENRGATSDSPARTEKEEKIAEFSSKIGKAAASSSETEAPATQPLPSETSGGGTMPQISGAVNGPSENLYSIPSENVGLSQLGMNVSSEPWKQTSEKERDPIVDPSICDTVIQKTVIESVAVPKPEAVKEEKMPETVPVATLNPPEVLQQATPVVSARGGGVRVPSPVAATIVSAVVKQQPTPVVSPPPLNQPIEAMLPSMSVKAHPQAQPLKEVARELPVKHQVPAPKSLQTSTHKVAPTTATVAPKGSESVVTKKVLPVSREGSSERKKFSDIVVPKEEKKEEKTVEPVIPVPVEEPLPQRQQPQANGDDSLDGKPTQRPKTKKVHKNRELNRKGAEKEGTDMDAFSDAQQQQKQEAAAAAAAAAAVANNANNAAAAPVSQRIETPTQPPNVTTEKVVNEISKSRTVTPPPANQVAPVPTKTSALPPSITPKGAAVTNENVPVQLNSNTSSKVEPPKVPSSKSGNEKNLDNKLSSVEMPPVVPEQSFVGNANSQRDEVEKEVAVEKITEDSVSEVPRVKVDKVNENNVESTKVEQDLSSVEKIDKQEEMVAVKNSENALVSAAVPPKEEKKSEEEEANNKKDQDVEMNSTPSAPTPVIENVASDAAISKLVQKNDYKEDQWSPFNPQGKKKYERDFLLGLQNNPQSIKKPENLPDIDIVLKDSTNRMPTRQVDLRNIAHLSKNSQDFAPCFVKSLASRPMAPKRNSQQGKPKGSKVVYLTIPSNSDVKLHESENAWKPRTKVGKDAQSEIKETEELNAAMRGILNKLTPQNFEKLVQQVLKLPIDTMDKLVGVINLVFDKAVDEPNFSVAYAELCNYLNNANIARQVRKGEDSNNDNFRKILLKRCQKEFEKDKAAEYGLHEREKEIEKEPSEEKKKEMRLLMEEDERRMRRKSVGVTRFIGELYKLGMINQSIMVTCIKELLEAGDEESLECLCKLLSTVGKVLEEALDKKALAMPNTPSLNLYFNKMKAIVSERKTSSRVRFMLQDVIDLKNSKWVPRRDESNPKKIDQINMEAERETMEQNQLTAAYTQMSRGSMGGGMGRRDDGKQKGEDWSVVSSRSRALNVDAHKLKVTDTDNVQLGSRSQHSVWSKGATGGSSNLGIERKQNIYNMLGEESLSRDGGRRIPMRQKDSSQSYTKSSSTSSVTVVPAEEKERALAAVRRNAGGPQTSLENPRLRGVPPSKTSSRDSSVSEENSRSMANSEAQKAPARMSQDAFEKLCKLTLDDYMSSMNAKETYDNMKVELPPANYVDFIQYSVEKVLETNTQMRQSFGRLLVYLISHQLFNKQLFVKGLNKVLESAEDMLIDVPMFWNYIADIVGVMLEEEAIPLSVLQQFTSDLPESLQGPLILAVLNVLHKDKGPAWISEKWAASSLHWNNLIPPKNVDKFVKDNTLEYIAEGSGRGQSKSTSIPMEQVREKLYSLLKSSSASTDDVFEWIEANLREKTSEPSFIRALTTAVFESAINNSFKEPVLQTTARLLQRYLNNDEKHELQCLYAIQALVHKLEHPKGLILKVFEFLHNFDVISQESFIAWEKSLDEPDGKAVSLKSLTQFFTYLTEPEDDSAEEA